MRRKNDDKRVLRAGNGRQQNSRGKRIRRKGNRQVFSRKNNARQPFSAPNNNPRRRRKKAKTNNKLVFLMIFALVAFVIGAGIGVSLSFDNGDDGPKYENVTKEMTQNLNDTNVTYFDDAVDDVDYNENGTQFDINYESGYGEEYLPDNNQSSGESESYQYENSDYAYEQ